jgi:2-polyprenyl-3-methyl-5-hydroxy-6-metoxy-1,4-benzoquinol methylase
MMIREPVPEAMDDPCLESGHLRHALRGLSRLNLLSGSARILWPSIVELARREKGPLRVLDLASGGGDVPLGLWRRARRAGVDIEFHGVDVNPRAVRFAREQAGQAGAPLRFDALDVLNEPLPDGFDIVLSSLFLHHVPDHQAVHLLTKMRRAARRILLINDLARSVRGLALAHAASRLFTTSDVVHTDAPRSVRAAFTVEEMRELARRAELKGAEVSRRWPFRLLLTWEPA